MSINDDILSRELKHRALLSLYEKKLDNDLTKVMSSHKKRLVNSTLKNGMKGSNALNRALGIETRKTYRRIYREALKELKQLAKVDAKFQASTLNKAFGKVYRARVYTGLKVNDLIINSAGTYSQQITSISLAQQRRIKSIVKQGMVDNLAVNKIADNIGRTVDLPQAQLRTLSRTAITETSTTVNKATYKLNEDVLDGYEYVATLDSRTSLICANLDGRVFRLNDPKGIRPPQHFNCRSTTVPIVKSHEDLINTDSNRISKRRLKRMTRGKRASFNGQVPAETRFEDFFTKQDNDFKLAVLGNQKRVDIFNTGKLKFKQFSTKDGKLVSIDRLNELLNGVKKQARKTAKTIIKVGTLTNVPSYKELKIVDKNTAKKSLNATLKQASEDPRYRVTNDDYGYPFRRFASRKSDKLGRVNGAGGKVSDEAVSVVNQLVQETNALADKYNVPRIRGVVFKDYNAIASMGDGELTINYTYFNKLDKKSEYGGFFAGASNYNVTKAKAFKLGDDVSGEVLNYNVTKYKYDMDYRKRVQNTWVRPHNGYHYFDDPMDRARNTVYHEFGHQIHQNFKLTRDTRFSPYLEDKMDEVIPNATLKTKRPGASRYGNSDNQEWFAENFALYEMNRKDLVDPDFIELFEKEVVNAKK